jgi:hypothetical protein
LAVGVLPEPWYVVRFSMASIAWPLLLIWADILYASDMAGVLGGLVMAAANAAVGAAVARGVITVVRAMRSDQRA